LPDEVSALANHRIVIPMFGRPYARPDLAGKLRRVGSQRCLGVSASLSIILYIALNQTTNHKDWRLSA
jgi:hypothetical protein